MNINSTSVKHFTRESANFLGQTLRSQRLDNEQTATACYIAYWKYYGCMSAGKRANLHNDGIRVTRNTICKQWHCIVGRWQKGCIASDFLCIFHLRTASPLAIMANHDVIMCLASSKIWFYFSCTGFA